MEPLFQRSNFMNTSIAEKSFAGSVTKSIVSSCFKMKGLRLAFRMIPQQAAIFSQAPRGVSVG
jgi:hypothetical protein